MNTKNKNWVSIAEESEGAPYRGAGSTFHRVEVEIFRHAKRQSFRVEVREKSGSDQGYEELHSSTKVVAIADDLDTATRQATARAQQAQMTEKYLIPAMSCAHAAAIDALDEDESANNA